MVDEAKQEQEFEPTPYHNAYRKDLDKPVETKEINNEDTQEATPQPKSDNFLDTEKKTKEQEHDFKKRYDDLKTHYDRKVNEWKEKEKSLTQKPIYRAPKSEEELENFKEQYPDIYNVVESISHLQADKRVQNIESKLSELKEQEKEFTKQTAYKELLSLQPDFDKLKGDKDFTAWLNEQPENISDGIYKNSVNAKWAARIIDLYKADHNLQTKQKTSPNAAEAVTKTKRGSIATDDGKKIWSVSEIAKLKPQQFVQYEKEIDQARREGRIEQT